MLLLGGLSALLAGGALTLALRETAWVLDLPEIGQPGVAYWSRPHELPPLSSRLEIAVGNSCIYALTGWELGFFDQDTQRGVAQNCADFAAAVQAGGRATAEDELIEALAAWQQGEADATAAGLQRAQNLAPADQWLALRRLSLARKIYGQDPRLITDDYLLAELRPLVVTDSGLTEIARLYVDYAAMRETLIVLAERMTDVERARFLRALRREVQ